MAGRPGASIWVATTAVALCLARCGGKPTEPTPVCSIAIAPANLAFGSEGGTGTVSVVTPAGCAWSVTAGAGWIVVTAGGSGSGSGTVAYSVAANPATESRNGALAIDGQSHTVTQEGRPATICSYDLSPGSAELSKDADTGTFSVRAPSDCGWTAVSDASWLTVSSGHQGAGDGTVMYTVARNFDAGARTGTIRVADRAFTVRQAGDLGVCQYSVAPVDLRPCMPGGSLSAAVTAQAGCPWTATSNAAWLGISSGASGTGSGAITMTFSDNYDAPREGIVMVRWPTPTEGQNIHVAQAGCLYAVSRRELSFASGGGSGAFDVYQQAEPNTCGGALQDRCVWTAWSDVPWITIVSSMPRSGDNPVSFTVAMNTSPTPRVGRITVRDQVVVVSQAGQ